MWETIYNVKKTVAKLINSGKIYLTSLSKSQNWGNTLTLYAGTSELDTRDNVVYYKNSISNIDNKSFDVSILAYIKGSIDVFNFNKASIETVSFTVSKTVSCEIELSLEWKLGYSDTSESVLLPCYLNNRFLTNIYLAVWDKLDALNDVWHNDGIAIIHIPNQSDNNTITFGKPYSESGKIHINYLRCGRVECFGGSEYKKLSQKIPVILFQDIKKINT